MVSADNFPDNTDTPPDCLSQPIRRFFTFPHFLNAAADVQPLYLFQAALQKFSQYLFFYFKSSAEWLYPPDSFGIKPVINRFKQNLLPSVNTLLFHLPLPYSKAGRNLAFRPSVSSATEDGQKSTPAIGKEFIFFLNCSLIHLF